MSTPNEAQKRAAIDRMAKRIHDQNRQTGDGRMSYEHAQHEARKIARRHDQRNND